MAVLVLALVASLVAANFAWLQPRMMPVFLLVAGLLHFGAGPSVAGMALSAWWLAVLLALAVWTLLWISGPPVSFSWPEKLYALFLLWCGFELLRADDAAFALRMFLKLAYPFAAMLLGRRAMLSADEFRTALKWVLGASFVASLLVGGFTQRFLPALCWGVGAKLLWACASFADHAAMAGVLALVAWCVLGKKRYLALALWLGLSGVLAGIRTGMVAFAVGAGVFALVAFRKSAAVPLVLGVYLAAALVLFALPSTKARMFYNVEAVDSREVILRPHSLPMDELDTSGRFSMWETVLEKFFLPDPAMGSGLGATQAWFYSGAYGRMRVEHSSYVRLLSDTGVVGLSLFLMTMFSCMPVAWRIWRESAVPEVRFCALLVLCIFPALMVCMAFDNLINYVLPATQYPFAFAGILLGLEERTAMEEDAAVRLPTPGGTVRSPEEPLPEVSAE